MKAIILAAGRGSRLLQHTDDRPKCLVELHGQSLLNWQLLALGKAGIEHIMVVRGYKKEMIAGSFEFVDNPRWNKTNMVASLLCAKEWLLEGPCIVSYSDIVYPSDAVTKLMQSKQPLSVLFDTNWEQLWRKRFTKPLTDAESFIINNEGFIQEIGKKNVTLEEIQGQYMGLINFTPGATTWILELLADNQALIDKLDMTGLISLLIKEKKPIKGVPFNGVWCEVDSESDLKVAEGLKKEGLLYNG